MTAGAERPFASIESADEFLALLALELQESGAFVGAAGRAALRAGQRDRLAACQLAALRLHHALRDVVASRRLLRRLRRLRGLLVRTLEPERAVRVARRS